MIIYLHDEPISCPSGTTVSALPFYKKEAIPIVNGISVHPNQELLNKDRVLFFHPDKPLSSSFLSTLLKQRYGHPFWKVLQQATVAIAGLGGLGSHLALFLGRSGIGTLHLYDDDHVDITNIFRQAYHLHHLNLPKTEAMKDILVQSAPCTTVHLHPLRLTDKNVVEQLGPMPIVCEAFDRPESKALLANKLLSLPKPPILIASSGMAGVGNSNDIQTVKKGKHFYLCGDGSSSIDTAPGLLAPRVALCAAHQANLVLSILYSSLGGSHHEN